MLPRFPFHPRTWVLLSAGMLATATVLAAPKLTVTQTTVDFGVVECGQVVTGRFEVRNDGDAPLELTLKTPPEVKLKHADRTLAPQAQGTIEFEADTSHASIESARFRVVLGTNDPALKETALELRGRLNFAVSAHPGFARFVGIRGEMGAVTLTLTAADNTPFRITGHAVTSAPIQVEVVAGPPAAKQQIRIRTPADAPFGPIAGWLDVKTDHPKRAIVRLPISGFIRPAVSANLSELDFGTVPAGEPRVRSFLVKSNTVKPVEISPPQCDSPAVSFAHETNPLRGELSVRVTFTPGTHRGPFTATIRLGTAHPDVPVITIPVRAVVQ